MRKSLVILCLAALVGGFSSFGSPPAKADQSKVCQKCGIIELQYTRAKVSVLPTSAGLEVFGQKCFRPYGKLTFREQRRVDQIRRRERREGGVSYDAQKLGGVNPAI